MRKNAPGFEFWTILCFTPPPTSIMGGNPDMFWAYRSLQSQMSGGLRKFHQPTIWAARGRRGGGKILPKLERGQLFCQLKGENWITAGDCGAIVGMPRYRSGSPTDTANHFAWLAPLGSASKNSSKFKSWSFFTPNGPAKGAWGITPIPPKLGHRTASREEGGGRGRGAKSSKTRILAPFWHKAFI